MKESRLPLLLAILVLLLPILYVGSYLALVQQSTADIASPDRSPPVAGVIPNYRLGGSYADTFYRPVEQFDRALRPDTWGG